MTRDELVAIISHVSAQCEKPWTYMEVADRILVALEKEKEGEVVLVKGHISGFEYMNNAIHINRQGQLVFRPTKENNNGR